MSSLQVFRGLGDKPSPQPVVEPLLADNVLITRGIHEMDSRASTKVNVSCSIIPNPSIKLGALVAVTDPSNYVSYRAKVTGIKLSLSQGDISQYITMEKNVWDSH